MAHSVRQTLCADIAKLTEELVEAKLHSAQACLGSALGLPNPNRSATLPQPLALTPQESERAQKLEGQLCRGVGVVVGVGVGVAAGVG